MWLGLIVGFGVLAALLTWAYLFDRHERKARSGRLGDRDAAAITSDLREARRDARAWEWETTHGFAGDLDWTAASKRNRAGKDR